MRKLTFGMNLSLDGYIAAPGDDLGWSVPSDELFQWWSDRVGATGLALYGRKLWETMSSHWPTADQQPGATPAQIEFARRWRDMPKVVFSSTTSAVDWNARLVESFRWWGREIPRGRGISGCCGVAGLWLRCELDVEELEGGGLDVGGRGQAREGRAVVNAEGVAAERREVGE